MFKRSYTIGCLLVSVFLLTGCAYEFSKEDFRDIERPKDSVPIELNLNPNKDTIYIVGKMPVRYDFNSDGLNVWNIQFEIGGEIIYDALKNLSGMIYIDGTHYYPGEYKLKATLIVHSGTGSIADMMGAEGYVATKEWAVMIDN